MGQVSTPVRLQNLGTGTSREVAKSPLAVAGTPEVRDYMAIGGVNGEEIGEMSEIKEVVYAG